MLIDGNPNIKVGEKLDTGRKWIDSNGAAHVIFQKTLSIGAMPNNTTKNVAHGDASLSLTKFAKVKELWASNGTTITFAATATINATNVVVATTTDLSTYTGYVVIEYCN